MTITPIRGATYKPNLIAYQLLFALGTASIIWLFCTYPYVCSYAWPLSLLLILLFTIAPAVGIFARLGSQIEVDEQGIVFRSRREATRIEFCDITKLVLETYEPIRAPSERRWNIYTIGKEQPFVFSRLVDYNEEQIQLVYNAILNATGHLLPVSEHSYFQKLDGSTHEY